MALIKYGQARQSLVKFITEAEVPDVHTPEDELIASEPELLTVAERSVVTMKREDSVVTITLVTNNGLTVHIPVTVEQLREMI